MRLIEHGPSIHTEHSIATHVLQALHQQAQEVKTQHCGRYGMISKLNTATKTPLKKCYELSAVIDGLCSFVHFSACVKHPTPFHLHSFIHTNSLDSSKRRSTVCSKFNGFARICEGRCTRRHCRYGSDGDGDGDGDGEIQ